MKLVDSADAPDWAESLVNCRRMAHSKQSRWKSDYSHRILARHRGLLSEERSGQDAFVRLALHEEAAIPAPHARKPLRRSSSAAIYNTLLRTDLMVLLREFQSSVGGRPPSVTG